MYSPLSCYTYIAFEAIKTKLKLRFDHEVNLSIPEKVYKTQKACFVSLHKDNGDLRGCIGTIYPREKNLFDEISRNAVSAAFNDNRFPPLTASEFPHISISVDILTLPEEISSPEELDPSIYGVIVEDNHFNRAVLLPGIPAITTIDRQINVVMKKAGIDPKTPWENLTVHRFTSNRHH